MADVVSGSGSKLYISAELPATHDQAGFESLTWTLVKEVTEIGEYGREYESIDHAPIDTRIVESIKGNYREGQLPLVFGSVPADAGQVIVLSASESDDDVSFKIDRNDGIVDYNIGKVFSFKPSVSGGSVISVSASVTFNGARVTV